MAKIKGALLSLEAKGAFAKALIFTNGKQGQNVRKFHQPTGLPSEAQTTQREFFKEAKDAWNNLTAPEKLSWNQFAEVHNLTGYNLFISEYELDDMLTFSGVITAAQLKNLVAVPITVVPEAGAGFIHILEYILIQTKTLGTPHTISGAVCSITSYPYTSYPAFAYGTQWDIRGVNATPLIIKATEFHPNVFENNSYRLRNTGSNLTLGTVDLHFRSYYRKVPIL